MTKKLQFVLAGLFFSACLFSQNTQVIRTCATPIPDQKWDEWFNAEVEKMRSYYRTQHVAMPNYVIPVVVHIIHSGGAVGVGDNISQAQVIDQINTVNDDFKGIGLNVGNAPAAFAPVVADCNISFCLAVKGPNDSILPEPGINRVSATTIPGITSVPAGGFTNNQINNTIKPATIWDPTKYCNMWVLKLTSGLLGFATFPAGTTLQGVAGGGGATNDGVVMGYQYFGSIGAAASAAPYHKGRTTTHELGHWLGLRHVWGDGNCLSDFCNDTPVAKQANYGCPTQPAYVNRCGNGQSPNGEMTMNFMDYTDDLCMYMFTNDQKTRMQTAMSQGTYRNQLGTHGLCTTAAPPPPSPPTAAFQIKTTPCVGQAFTPVNGSTGGPTPTYVWSSTPSASFSPGANVASPAVTFTAPGTYTLYVTATNTAGASSASMIVSNVGDCPAASVCLDTITRMKITDTLITYNAPSSNMVLNCQTGFTGFLTGTNCYNDKEFAQFYPQSTYSDTPLPQVNSVIVLFNKKGTKSTPSTLATQIFCRIYSGSPNNGPTNQITAISDSLGKIAAITPTDQVEFTGNPNIVRPDEDILVHKFDFSQPAIVPSTGFFAAVQTPFFSNQDSIWIFSNTKTNTPANDSSSWVFQSNNNWRTMRYNRQARVQLAILPQITCRNVVGMAEPSLFNANVALMPNPNNGLFNLIFTLPTEESIQVRVLNALGQLISTDEFGKVSNKAFSVDLSSQPDGIYFVEIGNGKERIVKKAVVTH
jgi:hypothetical protein